MSGRKVYGFLFIFHYSAVPEIFLASDLTWFGNAELWKACLEISKGRRGLNFGILKQCLLFHNSLLTSSKFSSFCNLNLSSPWFARHQQQIVHSSLFPVCKTFFLPVLSFRFLAVFLSFKISPSTPELLATKWDKKQPPPVERWAQFLAHFKLMSSRKNASSYPFHMAESH